MQRLFFSFITVLPELSESLSEEEAPTETKRYFCCHTHKKGANLALLNRQKEYLCYR